VLRRNAVVGQPITTDDVLATIADLSEVWFLGRVFEKDLANVRVGAKAEIELNAFPKRRFEGTVEYVGHEIDPVARTVTARVRLSNPEGMLRVGLFGNARVALGVGVTEPVLVVARDALVEVAGKPVVFVREPDGDFELHEVVTGRSALGKVAIASGLREGEQVVVEGAFTLKSAVLKGTLADDD
jgi:membrane fusion protein, heavy metal efflux system